MYITLIRHPDGRDAVRGELYIDGRLYCRTLEHRRYLIPELIYPLRVTQSPRFGRLLPLVSNVPGRSGIRIHRGTRPEHSTGCILVSAEDEVRLTELITQTQAQHEDIRINITHFTPPVPGYPEVDYNPHLHGDSLSAGRLVRYGADD